MGTLLILGAVMLLIGIVVMAIAALGGVISLVASAAGLISSIVLLWFAVWLVYKFSRMIFRKLSDHSK